MTLSVKRAKDRAEMAKIVIAKMTAAGATATMIKSYSPRELRVRIEAPGGAYLHFDIDGDCPALGGTWNTPDRVWLSPALGDVNPHHFGKLSRLYDSDAFDYAMAQIANDVVRLASGEGYLAETDARIVAMRARYKARGWPWYGSPA